MGRLWQYGESGLRFARLVPARDRFLATIYRFLKERGAPDTCHLMGTTRFDGRDMDLKEALEKHLIRQNVDDD